MKKVALLFVCVNQAYWPYLRNVIQDCDKFFLTEKKLGYKVDYFTWSDMPGTTYGATVFPIEPIQWPMPTLMRYHLFLQEEQILNDYDYVFYLDADMRVVAQIGEEIIGKGLTMAEHPMYALRRELVPPLEPNKDSTAFIKRFGNVIVDTDGKPWFKPFYAAGGFQGGTSREFIKAMKKMRANIDKDFNNNYIAIWNDESHWNRYLTDYEGHLTVLSPSYVYPDSLIEEFYIPRWGKNYEPKIVTITKPFTVSKEGGDAVRRFLGASEQKSYSETCEKCGDVLTYQNEIVRILNCAGMGNAHGVEVKKS